MIGAGTIIISSINPEMQINNQLANNMHVTPLDHHQEINFKQSRG